MLRDFTKSNKNYIFKNKTPIICVSIFLILGIVIWAIFGLNYNFEINGYNEFSIKAGANKSEYSTIYKEAQDVVDSYGGDYIGYQIFGEGDNTEIIIRYTNNLSNESVEKVNSQLIEILKINADDISEHSYVRVSSNILDVVYTLTAILLFIVIASLVAYYRYNGASALAIIFACLIGSLGLLSINSILRLSVGVSFYAMMLILNVIITYFAFNIFESMKNSSWLGNNDYSTALKTAIKETKLRVSLFSVAFLLLGVLFVVSAPIALKYISLNIMFMSVVVLAAAWYVIPFFWSLFITTSRKKEYKVKATNEITNK